MPLDQIAPAPVPQPTTRPADRQAPPRALERYLQARDYYLQYRWQDAVDSLEQALEYDPNSPEIHLLLGRSYWLQRDPANATLHLNRAIDLQPDQVAAHSSLGRIAWHQNDLDRAIHELRLALACTDANDREPETVLARLWLGHALLKKGYLRAGIEQLLRYQQIVAQPADTLYQHPELARLLRDQTLDVPTAIGQACTTLGWYPLAADAYRQALQAGSTDPALRVQYIRALALAQQPDQATRAALDLLLQNPQQADPDLLLWVYQQTGRPQNLLPDLEKLLAEHPDQPQLTLSVVQVLRRQHRPDQAIQTLQQLLHNQPTFTEGYWQLAGLLQDAGRTRDALATVADAVRATADAHVAAPRILQELLGQPPPPALADHLAALLQQRPQDFAAHYVAGLANEIARRWSPAENALQRSIELDPGQIAGYLALGRLYLQQCRWDETIRIARAALQQGHRVAATYWLLARANDGLDQTDYAESNYQMVLRTHPQDRRAIQALAELYARTGNWPQAQLQYERILAADSRNDEAREALFRGLVQRNDLIGAQQQLAALSQLGAPAPTVARSAALLALQVHRDPAKYRQALQSILNAHPESLETRYRLAENLVAHTRYDEACQHVDRILASDPSHHGARQLLVTIYAGYLQFDLALDVLDSLLAEHPNRQEWLTARARACLADYRYEPAIQTLKNVLALAAPDQRELYETLLADAYLAAGQKEQAKKLLAESLQREPGNRPALGRLLALWRDDRRFDQAIQLLTDRLQKQPNDAWLRRQLLATYTKAEQHDVAQRQLLDWLAQDPSDFEANSQLVNSLLLAHHYDEALELARELANDPRRQLDYRWLLVQAYAQANQHDLAIDLFRTIMQENAGNRLDEELVRLLLTAGRLDQAVQHALSVVRRQPGEQPQMRRLLSLAYQRQGRPDLAEKQLEALHRMDPFDPTISNDLGYVWADAGKNLDLAEEMIRFAVGQRPREPAYLDSLGWVLYKKGQTTQAKFYLLRATQTPNDNDPVIYDHLGDAAWRAADPTLARQSWRNALQACEKLQQDQDQIDPEHQAVQQRVQLKLHQLDQNQTPDIAPLAGTLHDAEP